MKNIIFYSKSKADQHSPRLFEIMKRMPFQSEFVYYCVDPDPVSKKRNEDVLLLLGVKEVPTMYLNGEKYVGQEAFDCLFMLYNQLQGGDSVNSGVVSDPPEDIYYQPQSKQRFQQQPQYSNSQGLPPYHMNPRTSQNLMPQNPQMDNCFPPMNHMSSPSPGMNMNNAGNRGLSMDMNNGSDGMISGNLSGGGGEDSTFADPFAATDITGINSGNLTAEQILTPLKTKNDDSTTRSDELLNKYTMERDSMCPQPPQGSQTIPGMNMSMSQMSFPQMRR